MSTKAFKNDKVAQIKSKIDKAQVAIVTNYTGFSVEEITKLRRELQKEEGYSGFWQPPWMVRR